MFEEVELSIVWVILQDESDELGALGLGLRCYSLRQFVYDGLYIGRGHNNLLLYLLLYCGHLNKKIN